MFLSVVYVSAYTVNKDVCVENTDDEIGII